MNVKEYIIPAILDVVDRKDSKKLRKGKPYIYITIYDVRRGLWNNDEYTGYANDKEVTRYCDILLEKGVFHDYVPGDRGSYRAYYMYVSPLDIARLRMMQQDIKKTFRKKTPRKENNEVTFENWYSSDDFRSAHVRVNGNVLGRVQYYKSYSGRNYSITLNYRNKKYRKVFYYSSFENMYKKLKTHKWFDDEN